MKNKNVAPGKLVPYANNPRIATEDDVAEVAKSIESFGFVQPIVVNEEMVVIIGHTRLKAAVLLDLPKVPILIAEGLSLEEQNALRMNDNRLGENTSWDQVILGLEVGDLAASGYDLNHLAFSDDEMTRILDAGFDPNLTPGTQGGMGVGADDITGAEDDKNKMGERSKQILVSVICPECSAEFGLQPEDMKE